MPKCRPIDRDEDSKTARRIFIVGAIFAVAFGVLICRAVYFNLKDDEQVEKVAKRQYETAVKRSTQRGKILDALGRELAIDVSKESIFADPREIASPVEAAETLSKVLGVERRKLLEKLSSRRKFAWVKRLVTDEEAQKAKGLGLSGIHSMRENKRSYPNRALGASILGAVGMDSEPLGGIELQYNELLSWTARQGSFRRDARGHLYLSPTDGLEPVISNVELTIDKTLQYITERELADGVKAANAKGGIALVVDVRTGAVLASGSWPTFDPNEYDEYPLERWKNKALTDSYEPGSTFKVVVVAAALDAEAIGTSDIVDCENGRMQIADHIVKDAHPHGKLSVADVIRVSSNIGAHKVASKIGRQRLYSGIRAFGFGRPSGIDLPGEAGGLLSSAGDWSVLQEATIAFGQGIAATPLQMTMAFAAIAGGGELLRPYVVKRIVGSDGKVADVGRKIVVGRPVSRETAKTMTELLVRVTEPGGTGTQAASREYKIAGKTGTAQKANPKTGGYAKGKYLASFIGFAPADDPRIAVYVGMDEPAGLYYGGQVAAPVFKKIVEQTLHYLKVTGGRYVVAGEDGAVKETPGDLATIVMENEEARKISQEGDAGWRIPDFRGLTMREALMVSKDADITWEFKGTGVAMGQTCAAGSVVLAGTKCAVNFEPFM